jgi:hypothetical protein
MKRVFYFKNNSIQSEMILCLRAVLFIATGCGLTLISLVQFRVNFFTARLVSIVYDINNIQYQIIITY